MSYFKIFSSNKKRRKNSEKKLAKGQVEFYSFLINTI